jgi:hypothetical protein
MKAHIGVDEATGLVHSVAPTAANVGDVTQVGQLLHGKEKTVFGDAGYIGAEKYAPAKRGRKWYIAAKRSKVKAIEDETLRGLTEKIEHLKASVRAAVEHPFRVIKCNRPATTPRAAALFGLSEWPPAVGQQGADIAIERRRQAGQHIGQPRLRFMTVGPGRRQQAHDRRRTFASSFGSRKKPVFSTKRNRPDRVLDRVVVDRVGAVVRIARQRRPATQGVVDRIGGAAVTGYLRP